MTYASAVRERESVVTIRESAEPLGAAQWWPLSFSQEAQLIVNELAGYTNAPRVSTHFPLALRIRGTLDLDGLEVALNTVIRRHRGLTAAYHATDAYGGRARRMMLRVFSRTGIFVPGLFGQWMYPDVRVRIQHRSVGPLVGPVEDDLLARAAEEEAVAPLQLDVPPVMRASVISFDGSNHLLVLTISHMVVDGWSAGILRDELIALYAAHVLGRPCALAPVTSHSGEFAVAEHRCLRSGEFRRHAEYWQQQWNDAAGSTIRHDELPCAVTGSRPRQGSVHAVKKLVGTTDSELIRQLAREHRITPHVFFRTAFTLLLQRYTRRRRITFWTNFANRRDPTSERMVASCVRPHIVPLDVSRDSTMLDLCRAAARRLAEAQRHEALPEAALPLLGVPRAKTGNTRIAFDVWPPARRGSNASVIEPIVVAGGHQWVDLSVRFRDEGEAFALYATYNDHRYSATGVLEMLDDLVQLISCLVPITGRRVAEVICPSLVA